MIKKLINVAVFMSIWLGIPHYLATTHDTVGFYMLMMLTWIPATFVSIYLAEDD